MKIVGITILIYVAIFVFVIYIISKYYKEICEEQKFEYVAKINEKSEEIKILKRELEEARDNETIARRISNMNTEKIKEEYDKSFDNYKKEFYKKLNNIEDVLKSYGNPILAITKVKNIIKELSLTDQSDR